MKVFAVIGQPVAHSLSPAMHNAAITALGADARYVALEVRPTELPDAVRGIRALGLAGVNVTLPHKEAILSLLDEVDDDARAIGAVNTIVHSEHGRLRGLNTDAPGLVRSLEEAGVTLHGARVAIVGAGGAARAAIVGLRRAGASHVAVLARRLDRAEALASELGCAHAGTLEDRRALEGCDLVVQSSSATLRAEEGAQLAAALAWDALPPHAAVIDLVYRPRLTEVLRVAASRGHRNVDGLGMLLHQGALALSLWLGRPAPVDVMRRALEDALAARG